MSVDSLKYQCADTVCRQWSCYCLRRGERNLKKKQSLAAAIVHDKLVRFYCLPLLVRRSARAGKARHISPPLCCGELPEAAATRTRGSVIVRPQGEANQRHDSLPPSIATWDRPPHRPLAEVAGGYQGRERQVLIELRTC